MMTRNKRLLYVGVSFIALLLLFGCSANKSVSDTSVRPDMQETGYISDVTFEKMTGKERLTIFLSAIPGYTVSRESETVLMINLEDTFVPDSLRKNHGEGMLTNLRYCSFAPQTAKKGKEAVATISLNEMVPYRVTKQEDSIVVTFDVSALASRSSDSAFDSSTIAMATRLAEEALAEEGETVDQDEIVKYRGQKISLSFQDANIKSVFRSISEVSGYNIVAGPGVDQKVTVFMKDVPWDQALDTILEINGLGKKTTASVITVLPLEELQKAEEAQLKKDVAQGKLQQISIEAKIVEVSTSFTQQLGIRWGYGYQNTWNGRDYGILMGTSATGEVATLPGNVGLTNSNIAVNFPGVDAASVTTPGIGLIVGADKFVLDAKLEALELTGDGKIISSPKVTTLDNVKATIKQGQEIPYVVVDDEGNRTIEFKDAALLLEVKPTITPEGKISMEIKASNDYPDWSNANVNKENPPINTNSVVSTVLVNNSDTLVVGGVFKLDDQSVTEGIPGLSNMPMVGWLFKVKTVVQTKRELLIFVTPRIIRDM